MSKITKFISLGIDMYKAEPDAKDDKLRVHLDAGAMEKALNQVEAFLIHKNEQYKEALNTEEGTAVVNVTCEEKPVLCEVRFYPILPGDDFKTDYEATKRIDFTRVVSTEEGNATAKLPTGDYLVKVSKGSEYEITYEKIKVYKNRTTEINTKLVPIIDLSKEGYFAGDLHHHSIYSSPVWGGTDDVIESPKEVCDSMRASGLKFGALSDHHNILNHEEWKKTKTSDFHPIPSKEISTSNGHVLALGVDGYDVIYDIPDAEHRTENRLRQEFVRITDEIREKGGLPQLNHPRDLSISISWNRDFYDMTEVFDTIEIWNGSNPMYYGTTDGMAADFWRDLLEQGRYFPATTGSDTHNIRANDYHKLASRLYWFKEKVRWVLDSPEANTFADSRYLLESFLKISDKYLPMLEVWAKTSLTSGCVRTYVHLAKGETPSNENVLDALRKGHSFLTNGPILTVNVNGAGMGERTALKNNKADISIRLLSNRKLTSLTAYVSDKKAISIPLKEMPTASSYDYSMELKDFELGDTKYVFFVAASDVTNIAITNPVLF